MDDFMNTLVTIGTGLLLVVAPHEIITTIAGLLAIIFWIPRIKRQVKEYNNGSVLQYIKDVFKNN